MLHLQCSLQVNKRLKNFPSTDLCLQIDCLMRLSGMPDLTLVFSNPQIIDDISFHPCVRYRKWEVRLDRNLN